MLDPALLSPERVRPLRRREYERLDPRSALLLIEVAGSSLAKDRVIKTEIYAEAGVPEYGIVDLRTQTVDVLTRPTATGYQHSVRRTVGDTLRPTKLRGIAIAVADLPWTARRRGRAPRR